MFFSSNSANDCTFAVRVDEEIKVCIHELTSGSLGEGEKARFKTLSKLHQHLMAPSWPHRDQACRSFVAAGGPQALRWTHDVYNRSKEKGYSPEIAMIELIADQVNRDPEARNVMNESDCMFPPSPTTASMRH